MWLHHRCLRHPTRAQRDFAPERLTNLWNRLSEPSAVLSWCRNASFSFSNFLKNSSQEIGSSSASRGSKSMRRTPGSPPFAVSFTLAGTPWRCSTHFRISSWLVVTWASDLVAACDMSDLLTLFAFGTMRELLCGPMLRAPMRSAVLNGNRQAGLHPPDQTASGACA